MSDILKSNKKIIKAIKNKRVQRRKQQALFQMAQMHRTTLILSEAMRLSKFLNLTMIRQCKIQQLPFLSCWDFNKSWKSFDRHRPAEQKMKWNVQSEIYAIHCCSFSFKWIARRPSLNNSLTCSSIVLFQKISIPLPWRGFSLNNNWLVCRLYLPRVFLLTMSV